MLGWIIPMFIVELYVWAIDPPWLRTAWAVIVAYTVAVFAIIHAGVLCLWSLIYPLQDE